MAKVYKFQIDYNGLLPYTKEEDHQKWLSTIINGIAHASVAGDYIPGVTMWTKQLSS